MGTVRIPYRDMDLRCIHKDHIAHVLPLNTEPGRTSGEVKMPSLRVRLSMGMSWIRTVDPSKVQE